MEEDAQKQNYELAFHISPNVEESKALQIKEDLEQFIVSHGGTIAFARVPEKIHLSYPIRHEQHSFFGYIHFSLQDMSVLTAIEEHIKLNGDIFRYLFLRMQTDEEKQRAMHRTAAIKESQERRAARKAAPPTVPAPVAPAPATEPAPSAPSLEKQIEDIIEGL